MNDKMKPEIKELWLEALRGGEYKQGRSHLNSGGKFCCLGVLTDLAIKSGVVEVEETDEDSWSTDVVSYRSKNEDGDWYVEHLNLPHVVQVWSGLSSDVGTFEFGIAHIKQFSCECCEGAPRTAYDLVELNDYARYTFAKIADVIEEQF